MSNPYAVVLVYPVGARVCCDSPFFEQFAGPITGTIVQATASHGLFVPDKEFRSGDGQPIQPWVSWTAISPEVEDGA